MATTRGQCQTLVDQVALRLPDALLAHCLIWKELDSEYQAKAVASGGTATSTKSYSVATAAAKTVTVNDLTNLTSFNAVPVAALLNSEALLHSFVSDAARAYATYFESLITALYSSFTTLAAVGSAGTDITRMVFADALNLVLANVPRNRGVIFATRDGSASSAWTNLTKDTYDALKVKAIQSPYVARTGSVPQTGQSMLMAPSAVACIATAMDLTNDAGNIQRMAVDRDSLIGIRVGLVFDGSDTQAMTFRARGGVAIAEAAGAIVVRC